MIKIILLLIACCLLFGASRVGKGIAILFLASGLILIGLVAGLFIYGFVSNSPDDSTPITDDAGYTMLAIEDLTDELANGVDSAKSKYLDQKAAISGRFDKMNSDKDPQIEGVSEDSIILSDLDEDNTDTFWIIGKMQTDEQRETFKEFTEGSMVVIRGTITDITESTVSIDIDDME